MAPAIPPEHLVKSRPAYVLEPTSSGASPKLRSARVEAASLFFSLVSAETKLFRGEGSPLPARG
jgi:hypothetical protein